MTSKCQEGMDPETSLYEPKSSRWGNKVLLRVGKVTVTMRTKHQVHRQHTHARPWAEWSSIHSSAKWQKKMSSQAICQTNPRELLWVEQLTKRHGCESVGKPCLETQDVNRWQMSSHNNPPQRFEHTTDFLICKSVQKPSPRHLEASLSNVFQSGWQPPLLRGWWVEVLVSLIFSSQDL